MLNEFNIFGQGIYLVICGMLFALARGIGRETKDFLLYGIILGTFGIVIMFKADLIKGGMFIITAILIIIYGLKFMGKEFER